MRAAVQYAPHDVRVEDVPTPVAGPGEVLVKIAYAGVCGTDPEIYEGRFGLMKTPGWPKGPKTEGHEASGVIEAVGPGCLEGYQPGQRVAMGFRATCGACHQCRNGREHYCEHVTVASGSFAEYAVYRESLVHVLPDGLSLRAGALLEPLSVAIHTIDLAAIKTGQTVAISGAGPIGLLALQLAARSGASRILLSEPVAAKRELALRLGADVAVDPLAGGLEAAAAEATEGRGFDVVIDASGNPRAAAAALGLAGPCGTVVWAGVYPDDQPIPVNAFDLYAKELTLRSVSLSPYSFRRALAMLARLDVEALVSEVRPLEDLAEVLATHRQRGAIKTLIAPSGDPAGEPRRSAS